MTTTSKEPALPAPGGRTRAVLDAARRVVEVLPLEGLSVADLIAVSRLPADVVRQAVRLLEECDAVREESGALYPFRGADVPALWAAAQRVLEVLPPEGAEITDLAARAGTSHQATGTVVVALYSLGLIRWHDPLALPLGASGVAVNWPPASGDGLIVNALAQRLLDRLPPREGLPLAELLERFEARRDEAFRAVFALLRWGRATYRAGRLTRTGPERRHR